MTNEGTSHALHVDTLIRLSNPWLTSEGAEFLRKRFREHRDDLDWGWLLDQAARHRILPSVGYNAGRFRLHRHPDEATHTITHQWILTAAYEGNRRRNEVMRAETAAILRTAESLGLPYALRKGFTLSELLYPDPGVRRMHDVDLLMTREHAAALGAELARIGYTQGRLSVDGTEVEKFSRSTRFFWNLHVNNALPYVKPVADPQVESIDVDFCHDLTPAAGPGGEERTKAFLERTVPIEVCGVKTRGLCVEDAVLDLCVHLHKEADSRHYIAMGNDLMLSKFMDIACAVSRTTPEEITRIAHRVTDLGVQEAVFYTLHYTAELFPGSVPAALTNAVEPLDRSVLTEYGRLEGKPAAWVSDFRTRLFSTRRLSEASDAQHLPMR